MPYPQDEGTLKSSDYLLRLLLAVLDLNGGELRVPKSYLMSIAPADVMLRRWDAKTDELILTHAQADTSMYVVPAPFVPAAASERSRPVERGDAALAERERQLNERAMEEQHRAASSLLERITGKKTQ